MLFLELHLIGCYKNLVRIDLLIYPSRRSDIGFLAHFNWASSRENLSLGFENNKSADQPAHPCSLISTFVIISFLESVILILATSEFSYF